MKIIAVNNQFLARLMGKPMDPEFVEPALYRYMQLVDVPDVDSLSTVHPELIEFSLYLTLFRDTPTGQEIAVMSPPMEDGHRNFFGDWFSFDERDWDNFTLNSDFDITYMLTGAVRNLLSAGADEETLFMVQSYGIVEIPKEEDISVACIYAAVAVQIPPSIEVPWGWQPITDELPLLDQMTLPRMGERNAQGAGTH